MYYYSISYIRLWDMLIIFVFLGGAPYKVRSGYTNEPGNISKQAWGTSGPGLYKVHEIIWSGPAKPVKLLIDQI